MGAVRPIDRLNSSICACAAIRSAVGEDSSRHVLEIQPWALRPSIDDCFSAPDI
jgi:hypothetical protein